MKFEKINNNKLKITLTKLELPENSELDSLMKNSSNARESFMKILKKAKDEVNFDTKNYKIKIDAQAHSDGNFTFTITKLVHLKSKKTSVKPKKITKNISTNSILIYRFEKLDDFSDFCDFLKLRKINYLTSFAKICQLYKYKNNYLLCLENINSKYRYIAKFYTAITEFSKFYSSDSTSISELKEYGELFIDNNAIITYQKYLGKVK